MAEAGDLLARTMEAIEPMIEAGVRTIELDEAAEDFIRSRGAIPAFKGFHGFPATLCISVNEEVVHGIPGLRKLKPGDLAGIDCGLILNGLYSDMARSYYIGGEAPEKIRKFMEATERSLYNGIEMMREGMRLGDISSAVQREAEGNGYSVVRKLVGHGIGRGMHEDPQVPNYGTAGSGPKIKNGMVFAIEPMINMGRYEVRELSDGWTIVTSDKSLSCHFEHTVAATENGPRILTVKKN